MRANCWRRERKTESWVASEVECEVRREEPWEAYWAEVMRERSKAARPTPLRDILMCCSGR